MQRTDWGNGSDRDVGVFKRNDDMLRLLPVAVVGYPQGNPALEKLAANARAKGFKVSMRDIHEEIAGLA